MLGPPFALVTYMKSFYKIRSDIQTQVILLQTDKESKSDFFLFWESVCGGSGAAGGGRRDVFFYIERAMMVLHRPPELRR